LLKAKLAERPAVKRLDLDEVRRKAQEVSQKAENKDWEP
jgi:hypothetical protein